MNASILRTAWTNFIRSAITAIPAMISVGILLTLLHGLILLQKQADNTIASVERKATVTVYLKDDADPLAVANFITLIEKRADVVKPAVYISKQQAWESVAGSLKLDAALFEQYRSSLPASITVTPQSLGDIPAIERFLRAEGVTVLKNAAENEAQQKSATAELSQFVTQVRDAIVHAIGLFIIFFAVGGSVLIGSTVHLAIMHRRKEISLMKLIGANEVRILGPFILESIFVSVGAFVLHLIFTFTLPFEVYVGGIPWDTLLFEFSGTLIVAILSSYAVSKVALKRMSLLS